MPGGVLPYGHEVVNALPNGLDSNTAIMRAVWVTYGGWNGAGLWKKGSSSDIYTPEN